jgi:hypothetical protein
LLIINLHPFYQIKIFFIAAFVTVTFALALDVDIRNDKDFCSSEIFEAKLRNEIHDHSEKPGKFSDGIINLMQDTLDEIDFDDGKNCLKPLASKMSQF